MTIADAIEFLKMGGYGLYVWLSFTVFVCIFTGLWIVPYRQLKKFRQI